MSQHFYIKKTSSLQTLNKNLIFSKNPNQIFNHRINRSIQNISLCEVNKNFEKKLLILYGGETGNCEDLAKRIGWQALKNKFKLVALKFDDYDISKIFQEEFILFICSTTNEGNEPLSIKNFWEFIMKKQLHKYFLSNLKCAVIGLGDSSYLKYNVVAKKLFKRLKQLGANLILEICLGDDQHDLGLDAAVDPWLLKFWSILETYLNNFINLNENEFYFENIYKVNILENNLKYLIKNKNQEKLCQNQIYNNNNKNKYYLSEVISNERITSEDHFQDTRLMKLKIPENNYSLLYKPGDIVMILPENRIDYVNQFISFFKLRKSEKIIINKINKEFLSPNLYDTLFDQSITIEDLVKKYFDISCVPKRSFFQILSVYSKDLIEKNKLEELGSTLGQQALYEYCRKPKRSILEIFCDFPNTSSLLKITNLIQLIPPIFPRSYSIASSLNKYPKELHVLYSVKIQKTMIKKLRLGLCSNYLKILNSKDKVNIFIRKGFFKLPNDQISLIMIGPGTGVAPFRSFIQDRISKKITSNFLFFGCRYKSKDYFFEKEWNEYNSKKFLNYFVAFSREQSKKIYVQDKLWEQKNLICKLLKKYNTYILVSGNNQMPKHIREILIKILQTFDLSGKEAEIIIEKFEKFKKLQFECWD